MEQVCKPGSPYCQGLTPTASHQIHSPVMYNTCGCMCVGRGGGESVLALLSCVLAECLVPWATGRVAYNRKVFLRPEVQNQGVGSILLPLRVPRKEPTLPLPCFWQWPAALGVLGFWRHHSDLCLCRHMASSLCVSSCLCPHPPTFALIRTPGTGFRTHSDVV